MAPPGSLPAPPAARSLPGLASSSSTSPSLCHHSAGAPARRHQLAHGCLRTGAPKEGVPGRPLVLRPRTRAHSGLPCTAVCVLASSRGSVQAHGELGRPNPSSNFELGTLTKVGGRHAKGLLARPGSPEAETRMDPCGPFCLYGCPTKRFLTRTRFVLLWSVGRSTSGVLGTLVVHHWIPPFLLCSSPPGVGGTPAAGSAAAGLLVERVSLATPRDTVSPAVAAAGAAADACVPGVVPGDIPPVPRSIHDISNGDHILGFGAQLSEDHPGFSDEEYKQRRSSLADLAKTHKIGEPIPSVDYSGPELETWSTVVNTLTPLYPTHACSHFLRSFPHFGFTSDRIPQLEELSQVLRVRTGWQIRPVAGLLHPRDFLNGLAFRYFHSTQYIRHGSQPMYTPEPDICHELLGHVPMLADAEFAELAQAIGEASLGATEKEIWHLTKLYWYTVEFGTILEGGKVKAFGAGILSSYGELAYMRDGVIGEDGVHRKPSFIELDPFSKLPKMSYKDGFQKTYFLCNSFQDVATKLKAYASAVKKPQLVVPRLQPK